MSTRLPRWLRLVLFVLLLALAIGGSLKALQETMKPTTLKLAVGSVDGEAARLMTAIGSRLTANGAPVRVTILDKGNPVAAAEAFAAGEAQLAVVRADSEELASARTVVQLANLVLMIVVPANSPIKSMAELKGRTVGVVGLETNRRLIATLVKSYSFPQGTVQFVDVPFDQLAEASRSKKYQAAMLAVPLSERYIGMVRNFFATTGKSQPRVLEIDAAEAIALETKHYESFDIPKGALRGAPAVPDDSITTIRVPLFLVAGSKVSDDMVTALTKAIMEARRELVMDSPVLAQIAAPDDDKNAAIPIHPGAKAFFEGTEKTWSDKYGDWLFYGPIILGAVGSFLAGVWKFLTSDGNARASDILKRVSALVERTRKATTGEELEAVERDSDVLLGEYLDAQIKGQIDGDEAARVNLMIQHMESAIARRSQALNLRPATGSA